MRRKTRPGGSSPRNRPSLSSEPFSHRAIRNPRFDGTHPAPVIAKPALATHPHRKSCNTGLFSFVTLCNDESSKSVSPPHSCRPPSLFLPSSVITTPRFAAGTSPTRTKAVRANETKALSASEPRLQFTARGMFNLRLPCSCARPRQRSACPSQTCRSTGRTPSRS